MKKNIIANLIGRFWGMLSNFLFIPLYIHYLGFNNYTIISFTFIIAGLMTILDAGLTATLSREFARSDNLHDDKLRIYRTLETCYSIIVLICIFVVFAFSDLISIKWLNITTLDRKLVSLCIKVFSFDIGFQLLFRFYMGGLLGIEKQVKANLYQITWAMLRNGLVVLVIMCTSKLEIFFIWQTLSTIIFAILIKLSLEKILYGRFSFNIKLKIEKSIFNRTWKFAGGMMLITFVASLNTQMDKLAISKLLSLDDLGYYTLAISLSSVILAVASPFSAALLPRFTFLYSEGKDGEASVLFQRIGLFLATVIFSIYANMLFFSKQLFYVWTGNIELAASASVFLPLIAFSISMLALAIIPFSIAIANGYTKLNNIIGIISLLVTLPGYWIATKYFGAIGAASVYCCVQTITTFVYFYYINKKFIKVKLVKSIYIKQIFKPLVISITFAYLLQLIPNLYENNRFISFLWIGISTIITLLITFFVSIPKKEITHIFKY